MKILWFTWKDMKNPYAGGAEVVNEQLAKKLVADGHEVIFLVRSFYGAKKEEMVDGYKVIRMGNHHTVYWEAYKYYKKNLRGWADLVIEEVNHIPFYCNWYVKEKSILFIHNLGREIWFYEMGRIKGLIGYLLEPIWMRLLGNRNIVTISGSTKKDLIRFGFKKNKIKIISEGIELEPVADLNIEKFKKPTLLSLGALRAMKRADQIILAFELVKKDLPDLQLVVAGCTKGKFVRKVLAMIESSPFKDSIQCLGKVSQEKKIELMQKSHLIAVTSIKEGWGLIVTEANSQGTPAVVYDVDGLRDSCRNLETGFVCEKNTPENLSEKIQEALQDKESYERIRQNAWNWSKEINFDKSYEDFSKLLYCYAKEKNVSVLERVASFVK
ncbi:MAG: Glycosyl transferase, group 1 [Candidatus Moranbacteria bacterium GW2011_GWE1_36_7]|nr:MAG: Glycosyl transferase, group 1 [Candidatus Moranbacteria bacterium GW2011_GWD2_36_12]KKQ06689.1 MAG: Glycosyl transferase, group 1 [Candidatus Moranbacteria bacterium GW2011_GWE2_36_40]KKQ14971.1 MAG: Glycosyl transferase, group 1 [Candidatus Moranbacteria bacterium GW2011_GWE1_36_7]